MLDRQRLSHQSPLRYELLITVFGLLYLIHFEKKFFYFFEQKKQITQFGEPRYNQRQRVMRLVNGLSCPPYPSTQPWSNQKDVNFSTSQMTPSTDTAFLLNTTSCRCSQSAHNTANLLPRSFSCPQVRLGMFSQKIELDVISDNPWLAQITRAIRHSKNRCSMSSSPSIHNIQEDGSAGKNRLRLTRVIVHLLANSHAKSVTFRGILCYQTD